MAEGLSRSNSMEHLLNFTGFTTKFESQKEDMTNIVEQLKDITEETIKHKARVRTGAGAAVGVSALGVIFATLIGVVSIILPVVVATLLAGGAVAGVRLYEIKCDRETVDKAKPLITDYTLMLEPLKENLEDVKKARRDMMRNTGDLDKIQTEMEDFVSVSEDFIRGHSVGHLRDVSLKSNTILDVLKLIILRFRPKSET